MSTGSERHAKIVDKVNNFEVRVHISYFAVQINYMCVPDTGKLICCSFRYKDIQHVIQHINYSLKHEEKSVQN